MMPPRLHNDPDAERLWRQCRKDPNLKWLLEGLLDSKTAVLGRILLVSTPDLFGQLQAPVGRKFSLLFKLTGLPYLSSSIRYLAKSWHQMAVTNDARRRPHTEAALKEWTEANGKEMLDRLAAAVVETVRRNAELRSLVTANEPITHIHIARAIRSFKALDWTATEELKQLLEPFLARPKSKKPINRFTLDFVTLLRYSQPEITQLDITLRSAEHFTNLLKKREVSETAARHLILDLVDRDLVASYTPMYLWCKRNPDDGFVASLPLSTGTLPPYCPSCGDQAHAIACYAPSAGYEAATNLKDGLLGAAIGWHLTTQEVRFWHSHVERGTETDFIAGTRNNCALIECKMFNITTEDKQLHRTLRNAEEQLASHRSLLEEGGWKIGEAICVVNLTRQRLRALRPKDVKVTAHNDRLISYEAFADWLRARRRALVL